MLQENMRIQSTTLGFEDHGFFTFNLDLRSAGSGQGFGNFILDAGCTFKALTTLLKVVGVESWEQLPGKYVRVQRVTEYGLIRGIGNIIEDKWFHMNEMLS